MWLKMTRITECNVRLFSDILVAVVRKFKVKYRYAFHDKQKPQILLQATQYKRDTRNDMCLLILFYLS